MPKTCLRHLLGHWQPTPVFLPGESHGRRSLIGCSPWRRTESDTTEEIQQQQQQQQQASLSFTISWSSLKLIPIELVMPFNRLILCRPLLLLPSIFPGIRVFSNESALCIRWPKYQNFMFSISSSNEYSELTSFRIGLTSLQSEGLSRVFSSTTGQGISQFRCCLTLIHIFFICKIGQNYHQIPYLRV